MNSETLVYNSNLLLNEWFGQVVAMFHFPYLENGGPSEAQKVMISQILLAVATGKSIKIYSDSCNPSNYNNLDQIILNAN